ncbi:MAG: MFS transporter [Candidatus Thiodiazotropha sp.]
MTPLNRSAPSNRPIPPAIWVLGFVSLLMDTSSELIHSLLPVFLFSVLHLSAFAIGLIEGSAEATALIVKVFSGVLSDYWGRRKPLAVLGYGLAALSKPLFAMAAGAGLVVFARLMDRVGKGIRGAPRDALVAELVPRGQRGSAFGLRQSLDTVGAFLGPLLAIGLMLLWSNDFRAVFWVAVIPALCAVALLLFGVREPDRTTPERLGNPIGRERLKRLPPVYWWVVGIGVVFTLARFSEAFLVLRVQQGGLPLALVPLVLIGMNVVYALSAYPFGRLSDSVSHSKLLIAGLITLMGADLLLAHSEHWAWTWPGVALWGLHMGMTQGLLSRMVADAVPPDLLGTAFGFFNLTAGTAMLIASVVAGLLWDRLGAASTFYTGAAFCLLSLVAVGLRSSASRERPGSS